MQLIKIDFSYLSKFIKEHSLFQFMAHDQNLFQELLNDIKVFKVFKNEFLYQVDTKSEFVYVVHSGEIQINKFINDKNTIKIISFLRNTEIFGEVSCLNDDNHNANAMATLDSTIICIPCTLFKKILDTHPVMSHYMLKLIANRLKQNYTQDTKREEAKLYTLFYPEWSERGSTLSLRMAKALKKESEESVLFISINENSVLDTNKHAITFKTLLESETKNHIPILNNSTHPLGFSVLRCEDLFTENLNIDKIALEIPVFLSRLRQVFTRILINVGNQYKHPIIHSFLTQCDSFIFVRNANGPLKKNENWDHLIHFGNQKINNFYEKVITISDYCRALSSKKLNFIDTNPLLYKNHFQLNALQVTPILENQERQFNKSINRIARKLCDTSRGIAFGGGGARALAQLGVIEVLEKEGLDFDAVSGVSMGAMLGAGYAMGKSFQDIYNLLKRQLPNKESILDKTLPIVSFFRGNKLEKTIIKIFSEIMFEDLELPFYCTSADLVSSKKIVFEKGYLASALRASVSIPGVFPPLRYKNFKLVDGGLINNIPGDILRLRGCKKIIGINVSGRFEERLWSENSAVNKFDTTLYKKVKSYFNVPPILNIVTRSLELSSKALDTYAEQHIDFIIKPEVYKFGVFDFDKIDRLIEIGRERALKDIEHIKNILLVKNKA